jgi:hypothetical protein
MIDKITIISEEIKKYLLDFKRSDEKIFDKSILLKSIKNLNIDINVNDKRINPQFFGWSKDDESPSLEWLSFILLYHLNGFLLSPKIFLLVLRTINYHGLWGLIDLFDNEGFPIVESANSESSDVLLFSYYQLIAKYYKGVGFFDKAQIYYLNAMKLAKEIGILPYAFSLQSKLNADYLLRKGMAKEYSKISYYCAKESNDFRERYLRRYIICLDTYAKDIFHENPTLGEKIYRELLVLSKDYPLNLNRIEFRLLEARITYYIQNRKLEQLPDLLREYNLKLETSDYKSPKSIYIRALNYLGFFRELIVLGQIENDWFAKKIKSFLNGEAEFIIKNCINEAQSFKDRRFIAVGYYELSFWMIKKGRIDDAIIQLKKGLEVFSTDKKSIINVIYTDIVKMLANLYGRKLEWEQSLFYYKILYDYLQFLTTELEKQKKSIEKYLPDFILPQNSELTEFVFLEVEDRKRIYMSLFTDYESIVKSLLEYGNNINRIQEIDIQKIKENMDKQNYLISHDLRKNYNNLVEIKNNLDRGNQGNSSKSIINKEIRSLSREISSMENNIDSYERAAGVTVLEEILLSSEAKEYISLFQTYYGSDIIINYISTVPIRAKFRNFDLYELLSNMLKNAYSTGQRNEIKPITVDFGLYVDSGIIYLTCSDNCGDYKEFETDVIQKLNKRNPIQCKKNLDGYGFGLTMLKGLLDRYNLNINWSLTGNEKLKTLTIPLTRINSDEQGY